MERREMERREKREEKWREERKRRGRENERTNLDTPKVLERIASFLRFRLHRLREQTQNSWTDRPRERPVHDLPEPVTQEDSEEIPAENLGRLREAIAIHTTSSAALFRLGRSSITIRIRGSTVGSSDSCELDLITTRAHEALHSDDGEEEEKTFVPDPSSEHTVHED